MRKKKSVILKEKEVWPQEKKEMSNTSVSVFQKVLFESTVVPKALTHHDTFQHLHYPEAEQTSIWESKKRLQWREVRGLY